MKTTCLILINGISHLAEVNPARVIKAVRYYEGGAIGLVNGVTLYEKMLDAQLNALRSHRMRLVRNAAISELANRTAAKWRDDQ